MASDSVIGKVRAYCGIRGNAIYISQALGYKDPNAVRAWLKAGKIPKRMIEPVKKYFAGKPKTNAKPKAKPKPKPKAKPEASVVTPA